jgi:hypothetical protein
MSFFKVRVARENSRLQTNFGEWRGWRPVPVPQKKGIIILKTEGKLQKHRTIEFLKLLSTSHDGQVFFGRFQAVFRRYIGNNIPIPSFLCMMSLPDIYIQVLYKNYLLASLLIFYNAHQRTD